MKLHKLFMILAASTFAGAGVLSADQIIKNATEPLTIVINISNQTPAGALEKASAQETAKRCDQHAVAGTVEDYALAVAHLLEDSKELFRTKSEAEILAPLIEANPEAEAQLNTFLTQLPITPAQTSVLLALFSHHTAIKNLSRLTVTTPLATGAITESASSLTTCQEALKAELSRYFALTPEERMAPTSLLQEAARILVNSVDDQSSCAVCCKPFSGKALAGLLAFRLAALRESVAVALATARPALIATFTKYNTQDLQEGSTEFAQQSLLFLNELLFGKEVANGINERITEDVLQRLHNAGNVQSLVDVCIKLLKDLTEAACDTVAAAADEALAQLD